MSFVQKLEFIIRRKDLETILSDPSNAALRITLGVTEKAKLEIKADGIKEPDATEPNTSPVPICPVPPDCPEEGTAP